MSDVTPEGGTGLAGSDLLTTADPRQLMARLVRTAAETSQADRCTLTSLDQHVLRVEASYEQGAEPAFAGHEYDIQHLANQPLLQEAVSTGRIVVGGALSTADMVYPELEPALASVRCTGIVPVLLGEAVVAVLILSRRSDRPFDAAELEAVRQLSEIALLALRSARLLDEVRRAQLRGLETLTQISAHMDSSDEPSAFFGKMSGTVASLVNAGRAAFWRLDGGAFTIQPDAHGLDPDVVRSARVPAPRRGALGGLAELLYTGGALRHAGGDGGSPEAQLLSAVGARDVLAVPWRTAAGPIGMLTSFDSEHGFSQQDEWIQRLGARASALVWQGYEAQRRLRLMEEEEKERLRSHAELVADLERQKSRFLQLASHELRTPITLVLGYLSMLEEGALGELSQPLQRVLPILSSRVMQMNQLVDRLLQASRMEELRAQGGESTVDVAEIVRRVAGTLEQPAGRAPTVLVRVHGPALAAAAHDEVETIVSNLVSNAIKYSPSGGEVDVDVGPGEPGMVAVAVHDNGLGIPAEDIPHLFQPFGRLEGAIASGVEGTGLGLYLSRNIATSRGGDITVSSTPSSGTTFTLTLPARVAPGGA